jgi:hypothetical protein
MAAGMVTETFTPDGLLVGSFPVVTDKLTLVSGQNVVRGEVLGKITTGGKLAASLSAATDGSETPYAIAAEAVDASGGDASIAVYLSGEFDSDKLTIGTAHTAASIKDGLRALGIYLKTNTVDAV